MPTTKNISLLAFISVALIIIGVRLHIIGTLAVEVPYWDDWGMGGFLYRHLNNDLSWFDYFTPANEHRMVFARLLAVGLFDMNQQQWDPMVAMVTHTFIWAAVGLFLIHIANENSHRVNSYLFCFSILVLWTFPTSLVNTLWGIQSHNYFMILFVVLGCWYIGQPALTTKWWLGTFCLFAACLTLAGGSFVGFSVAGVYAILAIVYNEKRHKYVLTAITAGIAAAFGLALILIQSRGGFSFDLISSLITFSKSMSWPMPYWLWPCIIYAIPLVILIKHTLNKKIENTNLSRFIICLYGFVFFVSLGIAFARSTNGSPPTRRYFEFLSLALVASFLALLFIQNIKLKPPTKINSALVLVWCATVFSAIPFQVGTFTFTISDRERTRPEQLKNVLGFINTRDTKHLKNKKFLRVPFHNPEYLAQFITDYQAANMLPYQLQLPPHVTHDPSLSADKIEQSPFIHNGTFMPHSGKTGQGYRGNLVIGSYKKTGKDNGMKAVGDFTSAVFSIKRPYTMIPIIGYTGFDGMSLRLINELTKEEFVIQPKETHSKYAEVWREHFIKIPRGYYRFVAEDNNQNLWFGFGSPRPVGRLSYFTQKLLDNGQLLWQFGCFLLLISIRKPLVKAFSIPPVENHE